MNVLITPQEAAVQYQRFEDFIAMVRVAGPGAKLGKFDLTDAYRHMLVHPDNWPLLGIHVTDGPKCEFYIETMLPFDHRLVPKISTAFSDVLVWVVQKFALAQLAAQASASWTSMRFELHGTSPDLRDRRRRRKVQLPGFSIY